jgi:hypothetical protein
MIGWSAAMQALRQTAARAAGKQQSSDTGNQAAFERLDCDR